MKLITILGPTATGKTKLAANLAYSIGGEIISADSRQVYKKMTIGTGKDYNDYIVNDVCVPYHLIDIAEPGAEYNIFQFQRDFLQAFSDIVSRNKTPILCGGSGMYLESIVKKYQLTEAPTNVELRESLSGKSDAELEAILLSKKKTHNKTDFDTRERLLRAIEIQDFLEKNPDYQISFPDFENIVFGINYPREIVRERITNRLRERFESGMIEEVQDLLNSGIPSERLKQYGLEYKFITMYILNEISEAQMFTLLNTAIHQFAKKQMTWFRRMEKNGIKIIWIDHQLSPTEKIEFMNDQIKKRLP
jgi:tRNA dimethylallyltransferase